MEGSRGLGVWGLSGLRGGWFRASKLAGVEALRVWGLRAYVFTRTEAAGLGALRFRI